ncbi:hypothetical protein Goarm_000553 [Gossypium armourianum]|uniref:RNase H type-1 domain-containing protein n=1 Tax=Gossypium armourianum TaxID=34283 RepID=A0A7J9KAH8_9ROSI|nr:hypothetical protein [Gossypium armourianum]
MENTGQYSVRSGYNPLMQGIGSSEYNGSPRISNDGRRLSKCGNAQCLLKERYAGVAGVCLHKIHTIGNAKCNPAEVVAALQALNLARDLGFSNIMLEGDSLSTTTKLRTKEDDT